MLFVEGTKKYCQVNFVIVSFIISLSHVKHKKIIIKREFWEDDCESVRLECVLRDIKMFVRRLFMLTRNCELFNCV